MVSSISDYSDTSEDEDERMPISPDRVSFSAALDARQVKIMDEDQVFKTAAASQEEATFVLEDAIVFKDDLQSPKIANLLDMQFADPSVLVVYGRLVLEPDDYKHLKKTALKSAENTYIKIKSIAFSIGSDSGNYAVWAYGLGRWFEINPRSEYEEMYCHMIEGVIFYYALTDLYEEHPNASVELALSRCGQRKGGPDGFRKIVQAVKSHGGFLLAQMMKPDQEVIWEATKTFQWLAGQCLDEYSYLVEKAGMESQPPPEIELEIPILAPWPHAPGKFDILDDEDEYMSCSSVGSRKLLPRSHHEHTSPDSNPQNFQGISRKPGKNASMSRITGLEDPAPGESSGSILAKLAIAGGKQNNSNDFSIKMLVAWVNRGFSVRSKFGARPEKGGISDHNFAADIVTSHALSILEHLPTEWKNRRLGKDLLAAPKEDPFIGLTTKKQIERRQEIRAEAAAFKLKLRRETNIMKKTDAAPYVSVVRPRKVETTTATMTTVRHGRFSGKAASLRIPGTGINRQISSEDESSSDAKDVFTGPSRKRRRASPPEMGEGDDDDELDVFSNEYNLPIRETELFVKAEPLPEIADLSPAETKQIEDEKKWNLDVVHKEAALNNRNLSHLEEFLAAKKRGPIQRSPLF